MAISAGSVCILESYEGIEGLTIDIAGGDIELTASDDGLNAAGGNDESGFEGFGGGFRGADSFAADSGAYVCISGGKLYIDASGDGIDSNGSLTVTGGETYVSGPDTGGNGALDYASEASITGGTFVAASPRKTESESRNRRAARSTAEPFLPRRIEYRKRNVPFFTCEKKGTFVLL